VSAIGAIEDSVSSERLLFVALGLTLPEYSYVPLRPLLLSGLIVSGVEHLCGLRGGTVRVSSDCVGGRNSGMNISHPGRRYDNFHAGGCGRRLPKVV